jgi:hypothetical protein
MDAFLWREPHNSRAEVRPDTNEILIRAIVREQPPASWGPVLGDFIHNTRSALDHLAIALVLSNDPGADIDRAGFPLFVNDPARPDAEPHEKRTWDRLVKGMAPEHIAAVTEYQPFNYPVGPHEISTLAALSNLSKIDKHRGLIPLGHFAVIVEIVQPEIQGWQILSVVMEPPAPLENDAVLARLRVVPVEPNPPMDVEVEVRARADVTLREGAPPDTTIDEVLVHTTTEVLDLVNDFEAKFFS